MAALGMVFIVVGGLLLLSATRSFALYSAHRRQPSTRVGGVAWLRMVAAMLVAGAVLIGVGLLLI
jgi:hypothetical protein